MSFTNADQAPTTPEPSNDDQPFLVVGDRVFKSAEDLANHVSHAQSHIQKLEEEAATKDQLIDSLDSKLRESKTAEDLLKSANAPKPTDTTSAITAEQLAAALAQAKAGAVSEAVEAIKSESLKSVEQANLNNLMSKAQERYGDNFRNVISEKAAALDIKGDAIDNLAKQNPKIFERLLIETKEQPADTNLTGGDINTAAFQGQGNESKPSKSFMKMSHKERAEFMRSRLAELED